MFTPTMFASESMFCLCIYSRLYILTLNELLLNAGRLLDLMEGGKLEVDAVKFFVLDEADRLLDTGNLDVIMKIFQRLPKASSGTHRLQASSEVAAHQLS